MPKNKKPKNKKPGNNLCVSRETLGIQHPYSYCVKPSEEMVPTDVTTGGLTMKNTSKVLSGLFNYVEYLTINADKATKNICKTNKGKGIIGNKYVLKTNVKCRPIKEDGTTISGERYLHKYIDNTTTMGALLTGGPPQNDVNGVIPSTFASAGKIGGNVAGILRSFTGSTNPYCMKVELQCHIINSKNSSLNYKGYSPGVYLSLEDIENIDQSVFIYGRQPLIPDTPEDVEAPLAPKQPFAGEEFTNLIDNIIHQNSDKIQSLTEFENAINHINFQDEFLIKTYYVGFSILLIIIIFKLINKKY